MERSIGLVAVYLAELCDSAARGEGLARGVELARAAEARMLARLGTNTHKGAIFLDGLLVLAAARAGTPREREVRAAIADLAREVSSLAAPRGTNGDAARRELGVRGILGEAEAGLPSLFEVALPAFRGARRAGAGETDAAFATLAALMRTVEDTTALHRCGRAGLEILRADGARLEALVARGAHLPFLEERNEAYRRMNLTMGGVADLLGAALGWLVHAGELELRGAYRCA
jgi:triphosphoribosyl-dephospho-CoA synthase